MTVRALAALAVIAAPRTAAACAVCLDSAFGDRGFTWAFVALMLTPFAVAATLGGVLARCLRSHGAAEAKPDSFPEVPSC